MSSLRHRWPRRSCPDRYRSTGWWTRRARARLAARWPRCGSAPTVARRTAGRTSAAIAVAFPGAAEMTEATAGASAIAAEQSVTVLAAATRLGARYRPTWPLSILTGCLIFVTTAANVLQTRADLGPRGVRRDDRREPCGDPGHQLGRPRRRAGAFLLRHAALVVLDRAGRGQRPGARRPDGRRVHRSVRSSVSGSRSSRSSGPSPQSATSS